MPPLTPPLTIPDLIERYHHGEPLVMVTAYDYPSAQIVDAAGVDIVLVGDSAAMTVLGHSSTVPIRIEEMLMLAAAARRGLKQALLIGDLPFGSYEVSNEQAVMSAQRFIKEAGCDAIKLERGGTSITRARAIVAAGIPVMGHLGLTPQTATALGGYRAQARQAEQAIALVGDAEALEAAGCFALVLEAIPAPVAALITERATIPIIGIGAGSDTDGQVLVFHDLLGISAGHQPRFVKQFAQLRTQMIASVTDYAQAVRSGQFPSDEHSYTMTVPELARFHDQLAAIVVHPAHTG